MSFRLLPAIWLFLNMSGMGIAVLAVSAVFVMPTSAQGLAKRILLRHATTTKYSSKLDVVTVFATEMMRYRQELLARIDDASLATTLTPTRLSDEFRRWTWRSADGSLLQSFAGGDLRLTGGDCLARLCSEFGCSDAGWPTFQCSDGHRREMVVTDFKTIIFGDISYERLSEPALVADTPVDVPVGLDRVTRPGN